MRRNLERTRKATEREEDRARREAASVPRMPKKTCFLPGTSPASKAPKAPVPVIGAGPFAAAARVPPTAVVALSTERGCLASVTTILCARVRGCLRCLVAVVARQPLL